MDKEFLLEDSKLSSIRWALVRVIWMNWVLVLPSGFHIVFNTFKDRPIEWAGIALLLAGLTGFLGAAVTGKWLQKKEEKK